MSSTFLQPRPPPILHQHLAAEEELQAAHRSWPQDLRPHLCQDHRKMNICLRSPEGREGAAVALGMAHLGLEALTKKST